MSNTRPVEGPRIGAMLRVVSNWVRDQVYDGVVADGYADINPAHLAMFRYPGLDGLRQSHLATQLQITKQAVNMLAGHLEAHGYITRDADPADGRARVIRLTSRGRAVQSSVHEHARLAELRVAAILGERGFTHLRDELERLFVEVMGSEPATP